MFCCRMQLAANFILNNDTPRIILLVQRIFKRGDIQNIIFTPDKQLNILVYGTLSTSLYKNL